MNSIKHAELVTDKDSGHGYLILQDVTGCFNDEEIGITGNTSGLAITFKSSSDTTQTIVEQTIFTSNSIEFSADHKVSFKIKLPSGVTNVLSQNQRKVGTFYLVVHEFKAENGRAVFSDKEVYFNAKCTGQLEKDISIDAPDTINSVALNEDAPAQNDFNFDSANTQSTNDDLQKGKKGFNKIVLALLILLLLASILGAIWYFLGNSSNETATEPEDTSSQKEESTTPQEEPSTTVSQTADDGSTPACFIATEKDEIILRNCEKAKIDNTTLLQLAKKAFDIDRCSLGKRIFYRYGKTDGKIAYEIASFYDVNSTHKSQCVQKDKEQAIYWYTKAVSLGNTDAKTVLDNLK